MSDKPEIPTEFGPLLETSFAYVQAQQSAHVAAWSMDQAGRFEVDFEIGTIVWPETANGMRVTAPAQLLGSWSPNDDTFLWGWQHPSAPPGTAVAAQAVKDYADKHSIVELQEPIVSCDNDDCFPLAAIASLVGDLQGVYRFETSPGGAWVYVGFGNVTLSAVQ